MILSIDPGSAKPGPACAYFKDGRLFHVEFSYRPTGAGVRTVIVERLETRGAADVSRFKTLVDMAWCGAIAAGYAAAFHDAQIIEVTPFQWKNNEPKPTNHKRLWKALSPAERLILGGEATGQIIEHAVTKGALSKWRVTGAECYPKGFKTHNLLCAAAIGASHLGRM